MVLGPPALAQGGVGEGGGEVKLLPYHRFEIASPMTRETAMNVMRAHIEPVSLFRWRWPSSTNDKRFEGVMTADGFDVVRILGYQNSFVPTVRGVISGGANARIRVTMLPHMMMIVVLLAVAGFLASTSVGDPATGLFGAAVLYGVTWVGFWFEANKQEQALREIFREPAPLVS